MAGRKRLNGERFPSGKLRPQSTKPDIEPISPALWGRIKQNARRQNLDPRLETELGRLSAYGEFTTAQTVAGFRIAEVYGRFETYNKLSRSAKSPSYNASFGESGISEDLLLPQQLEDLDRKLRDAELAWKTLEAEIPYALRTPVQDLCVQSKPINPTLYEDIRRLLTRLAMGWNVHGAPRHQSPSIAISGRHGPPLHFNRHEEPIHEKKYHGTVVTITTLVKRPNFDRMAFIQVLHAAAPKLDEKQLADAYDFEQALKQRAIIRSKKAARTRE